MNKASRLSIVVNVSGILPPFEFTKLKFFYPFLMGAISCRWRYLSQMLACCVLDCSRKKLSMKMRHFSSGNSTAL